MEYDVEELRRKLINYYGTAMIHIYPSAMMELEEIYRLNDEEIIEKAHELGII